MRLPVPLSTCHPKCFCSVMYEPEWAVNAPQGSFFFSKLVLGFLETLLQIVLIVCIFVLHLYST